MRNSDSIEERVLALAEILGSSVRKILDENKAERHIRGGMATKLKYIKLKKKNKLV